MVLNVTPVTTSLCFQARWTTLSGIYRGMLNHRHTANGSMASSVPSPCFRFPITLTETTGLLGCIVTDFPGVPEHGHARRKEQDVIAGYATAGPGSQGAPREILVVDDEPLVRYIVRRLLHEHGYAVYEAQDGAEALDLVRAAQNRLDLVVSDIAMPRVNGVQLLQVLSLEAPELPCILISGYTPPELERLGIAAPCGILTKPLIEAVFLDEVRRCLRNRN